MSKKTSKIEIRCTPEEHERWSASARESNLTLTGLVRQALLFNGSEGLIRQTEITNRMFEELDVEAGYFEKRYSPEQLLEHYRGHYHCSRVNLRLTLDEVLELREQVRKQKTNG